MLIRGADLWGHGLGDLRVAGGRIAALGQGLVHAPGEALVEARGGALLPGLHDHHIHLLAWAAAQASVACGPPAVADESALISALRQAAARLPPGAWLRGVGYHESVAGEIDRDWLDQALRDYPEVPVRIQHRGGRLWIFNSRGLDAIGDSTEGPFEYREGRCTGRLYEGDAWLRTRLPGQRSSLAAVSTYLARRGVTSVTDTTPGNDAAAYEHFAQTQVRGELRQRLVVMGGEDLAHGVALDCLRPGPCKIHLLESNLPDFDATVARIAASHALGRSVAVHCVTRTELHFTLAALEAAGTLAGDRIEHGAVVPPDALSMIARLGLSVVSQPAFITERGDQYLSDVDPDDRPWLYRLRGLVDAGIALAAGSDAPYGSADPWGAMAAAVSRRTRAGAYIGTAEALNPDQALALFRPDPFSPLAMPALTVGMPADLCLLDRPWSAAAADMDKVEVCATWRDGECLWREGEEG
ncbi:MAG: amidohydrolase family protein [Proteobacteria bacterium]|nr:amidohydrolase family protein [Pseudomonadota bacterium]HQR02914.1 amidohydrolase family protein [Rhodocyclaceae bacterium]